MKIASKKKARGNVRQKREFRDEKKVEFNTLEFVRTANHQSKRAKKMELRRQQYARVQQMFRKSPSLGAQFVMSGDHEKHSAPPAERYYPNIGKRSSSRSLKVIADLWREPSILLRKWMFTADVIIQALRNLKDFDPGLDGMKKCDLNKISPEDMATHVTLWLFMGVHRCAKKRNCYLYLYSKKTRSTHSRRF